MRLSIIALGCLVLLPTALASADDGPTLYKQLCATCHDSGVGRAPTKDVLQMMTPERVLTAMESGPMLSMAAGRTGVERRTIAEFVTGKTFSKQLELKPSPQAMWPTYIIASKMRPKTSTTKPVATAAANDRSTLSIDATPDRRATFPHGLA